MAVSCSEATTSSESAIGHGQIALAPQFTPVASRAYSALAALGVEVTNVHLRLTAPDGSTRDTVIAFPPGTETLEIELSVPLRTAGQSFRADVELRNDQGQVLFSGTQLVIALASNVPGRGPPVSVQINYTGPGRNVRTVSVSPPTPTLTGAGTLALTATGADAAGAAVSDLLVAWTSSDPTLATIVPTGNATATVTSSGKRGIVTLTAATPLGISGTSRLTLAPSASKIVLVSGGGQTGPAGAALPQPLVVEVQAADNLPVPGIPVTFRAVTAGGRVGTASATTDATGRASTIVTLGQTPGAYQFEAASGSLAAVTANETATPAPAAAIAISSGNGQSAPVGTALPQLLAVVVRDQFGTPVSGATVTWTRESGAGSLGNATSVTDAAGIAKSSYTFSTVSGLERIRASVGGVTGASGQVLFTETALAGAPANIKASGSGQHAPSGTVLPQPLDVFVTDAFGNPVADADVSWRVTSVSASTATFTPATVSTAVNGTAETIVRVGGAPGQLDIIAVVGTILARYTITVDAGSSSGGPGIFDGFVYDAVTGGPNGGVTVDIRLSVSQAPAASVTTATDGRFSTAQLPGGVYDLTFSKPGYVSTTIVQLLLNGNTTAEAVPMVPSSSSPGSISGRVIDATNGSSITGIATVELRAGMHNTSGTALQTVSTSGATYSFTNVPAGTYTVLVRAVGYADAFKTGIAVGATNTSNQDIFVSPSGATGLVRIVLTWRSSPRDLDSYLTGPQANSTGRFVVWYGGSGNCSAPPYACLDNDVTGGFGPETITISQQLTGRYRYSVNQYSSDGTIATSGARVDVYIGNVLAQSFSVPSGSGRDWTVFDLDGSTITPINTIGGANRSVAPAGSGIAPSRAVLPSSSSKVDDSALIEQLSRTRPKGKRAPY